MPTNLNALIRYKRIDSCLKNPYLACTIQCLQEDCTEAMGEFRGTYKSVSERTIRDDIRVLRSNILGFNAPIKFENGKYFYTDKDYSIFKTSITEIDLLKDILKMLLDERNNIVDKEIDKLLRRISIIVGEPIPLEIAVNKTHTKIDLPPELETRSVAFSTSDNSKESARKRHEFVTKYSFIRINKKKQIDTLLLWNEILAVL